MRKPKVLTEQETAEIKDLACEGMLMHEAENKQWYLEKIAVIVAGCSLQELRESASSAGYELREGKEPKR